MAESSEPRFPAASPSPRTLTRTEARERFNNRLAQEYLKAGKPSLRELERRLREHSDHLALGSSPTSLGRVLNGKQFPKWPTSRALLQEFGVPETAINNEWKHLWMMGADKGGTSPAVDDSTFSRGLPSAEQLVVCRRCGAWVGDISVHDAWHVGEHRRGGDRVGAVRRR